MERAIVLKLLIEESGLSLKAFAEKAGIPYTTLRSILDRGVSKASIGNVLKIYKALGITAEEMEFLAFGKKRDTSRHIFIYSDDWTDEELDTIQAFVDFMKTRRSKKLR
jgi:predicted transcriptional regulator